MSPSRSSPDLKHSVIGLSPVRLGSPWNKALHAPAKHSQTRNRTPFCLTERCTFTPLNSETQAPHFSCVPQNGHATANTAVPRWHLDLRDRHLVRHRNINQ